MKVAAIGRTAVLYESIQAIADTDHEVTVIVTAEAEPEYGRTAEDFRQLADQLGASFIQTNDINAPENVRLIRESDAEIAISVNWKVIIEPQVLALFEHGIVNCHAGDLPRYRGNAAPNWAILNGEDEVVVTLHRMNEGLDAGDILCQRSYQIDDSTTIADVNEFSRTVAPEMYVEVVEGLDAGTLTVQPQPADPEAALRCYPRIPEDSRISWDEPAEKLDRLVRATSEPLQGAYTFLGIEKVIIWRAHAEQSETPFLGTPGQVAQRRPNDGDVAVITGDGYLVLEEVETEQQGRTEPTDVITSHRDRLGMHTAEEVHALTDRIEHLEAKLEKLTDD